MSKFEWKTSKYEKGCMLFLIQKQPPEVFYRNKCSQENNCARVSFLIKLQALACNFIKKGALTQVFSCEFLQNLRTPFVTEHLRWLLLLIEFTLFRLTLGVATSNVAMLWKMFWTNWTTNKTLITLICNIEGKYLL